METNLLENRNIKQLAAPASGASAAQTGARVSMKSNERVAVLIVFGAGTGATTSVALKQHNAASAGTTKALAVSNPYYKKLTSDSVWTKVTPGSATDTYDLSADFGAVGGVVAFEVLAEDLDVEGGFAYFSANVADTVAAKIVCGLYLAGPGRNWPQYQNSL